MAFEKAPSPKNASPANPKMNFPRNPRLEILVLMSLMKYGYSTYMVRLYDAMIFFKKTLFVCKSLYLLGFLWLVHPVFADNIAFFYALDQDLQALQKENTPEKTFKLGNRTVSRFSIGGHVVCAIKMKSGNMETAVSAASLLAIQKFDRIFSSGPAGGLSDRMSIGTWHGISAVVPYQTGTWTASGFVPAERMELKESLSGARGLDLPTSALASGDVFVASSLERQRIRELSEADLIDMNLAGLAKAAASYTVPLTAVRVVSDHADDQAPEQFARFVESYDGRGAGYFLRWLSSLPENKTLPKQYPGLKKLLEN